MRKILETIMPILKCFKIRVKIGTLMAFLFCIILFYLTSKVLGFQNWTTFDQVFFVMFYLGFYGLMVHLFNYIVDEKVREINEEKKKEKINEEKEKRAQEEKEHFVFVLNHCSGNAKQFFKEFVLQNSETIIMKESQHDILNYLRLRGVDVQFLGDKYYKIPKEQFEIIKEYFEQ